MTRLVIEQLFPNLLTHCNVFFFSFNSITEFMEVMTGES